VNLLINISLYLIVYYLINSAFIRFFEIGQNVGLALDHPYFEFIHLQSHRLITAITLALGGCIIISSLVTMVMSQRLAGPVTRMLEYFQEITQTGKVQKLEFRKGDFFSDLPPEVNRAMEKICGPGKIPQ
jgi:hypothetical protein